MQRLNHYKGGNLLSPFPLIQLMESPLSDTITADSRKGSERSGAAGSSGRRRLHL